jgi:branched-chain amino acid transport system ATP-binding protein
VLTGLYTPTAGRVHLGEREVTGLAPHTIAHLGLARTFQNIRLFNLMTAEENVMVAMHSHMRAGVVSTILRTGRQRREEREGRQHARELLEFVGIGKVADDYARNLSYGDQRRLEVARALALRPKVLLLDEPTAGMNPLESARFVDFVHRVRDEKQVSVLLIEHDMSVVMRVSERITVLDRGEKIAEGSPDDIKNDARVVEAYLGRTGTDGYEAKE